MRRSLQVCHRQQYAKEDVPFCLQLEIKIDKQKLSLFGVKNDNVTELIKLYMGNEVIKPELMVDKKKLSLFGVKNDNVTELINSYMPGDTLMQARTAITAGTVQDSKDAKIGPKINEKHDTG